MAEGGELVPVASAIPLSCFLADPYDQNAGI
jgi:hypothetical protein